MTVHRELLDQAGLTNRQLEMYLLRAAGCGIRTIARAYQVSPATVRDHLEAADRKIERAKETAA